MRRTDLADLRSVVLDGHPRPVLLLGAGASVTSGVPLVSRLIDLIGRYAYCRKFQRDLDDPTLMRSDWYPWVSDHDWFEADLEVQDLYARHIQELLAPRERRRQFLQEQVVVSPEKASSGYRSLASLVGKRRVHTILTTNFDTLVTDSCRRDPSAASIITIQSPAQADLISTDPAVSQVVHVHGVVEHYADLNLTDEVAALDAMYAARIVPLIADHPLIVIGYRGAEPSVYRDLLLAAASAGPVPLPHGVYWCTRPRDGDLHPHVVDLAARCGDNFALVEIDGFDEVMGALDQGVARVPSTRPAASLPYDGQAATDSACVVDSELVERVLSDEALGRLALTPPSPGPDSTWQRLRLMNLVVDSDDGEALTNAGRLLFASDRPVAASVDIAGVGQTVNGNVFELYEALSDLVTAMNEPYRLKGPQSVDVRPYPPLAIKELLVNAVAHRDYESAEPIDLAIDSRRVRIANPGGLGDPAQVDDLGEREVRHYRNPSLAETLYAAGLMDKYGSGLVDVRRWARDGGAVATFEVGRDNSRFEAVLTSRPDSQEGEAIVTPPGSYEIYYLNALRVAVPPTIWIAPTRARRPRDIFDAHPGETVPRFVLDGRNIITFSDLRDTQNPLRDHAEAAERHSLAEFCSTGQGEAHVVELLNRMFERHMRSAGTEVHHRKARAWYRINDDGSDREIEYQARMRTATRTVARLKNAGGRRPYYEHQAMAWSFVRVGDEWLLTIDPTWVFTTDGHSKLETRRRTTQMSTKKMANERNQAVVNHVFFWAWSICGDLDSVVLEGDSSAVRIEHTPLRLDEVGLEPSEGTGGDDEPDPDDLELIDDDLDDDSDEDDDDVDDDLEEGS